MLALLSCSAAPTDDYDPYAISPTPSSPLTRLRKTSRNLSFIKASSRRKVSKMSIGPPVNFRHEFHLGMDIVTSDSVGLWDATRFLDELHAQQQQQEARIHEHTVADTAYQNVSSTAAITPSSPSIQSFTEPSVPSRAQKRSSITPQKRKPVPSLIPDAPVPSPLLPSDSLTPTLVDPQWDLPNKETRESRPGPEEAE